MTPIRRLLNIVQFDLAEKLNLARLRWYHLNHQDQYYDYSPSQVEAILFGVLQLIPEHQDYIITGLKKHLREFIQDDEQDEDMISQYTNIYNAIEKWESDHRETEIFQQLAVSELFNQLNK